MRQARDGRGRRGGRVAWERRALGRLRGPLQHTCYHFALSAKAKDVSDRDYDRNDNPGRGVGMIQQEGDVSRSGVAPARQRHPRAARNNVINSHSGWHP